MLSFVRNKLQGRIPYAASEVKNVIRDMNYDFNRALDAFAKRLKEQKGHAKTKPYYLSLSGAFEAAVGTMLHAFCMVRLGRYVQEFRDIYMQVVDEVHNMLSSMQMISLSNGHERTKLSWECSGSRTIFSSSHQLRTKCERERSPSYLPL